MFEAVIELGANLENRRMNIEWAIKAIALLPDTEVVQVSSYYETEPFDVPDKQNKYINCCVKVHTELDPRALLGACLGIEAAMGRVRTYKNASRAIDVDLLIYEGVNFNKNGIILPHPRIRERAFVMIPLAELYPSKNALGLDFSEHYDRVDSTYVKKVSNKK